MASKSGGEAVQTCCIYGVSHILLFQYKYIILYYNSIEGVDHSLFECVYSPAKRRGPVPGRVGQARKANEAMERSKQDNIGGMTGMDPTSAALLSQQPLAGGAGGNYDDLAMRQMLLQQQGMAGLASAGLSGGLGGADGGLGGSIMDGGNGANSQLQQLSYLQQFGTANGSQPMELDINVEQGRARRIKTDSALEGDKNAPDTVAAHLPLLARDSIDGNRLRAFYRLSVDELFAFPPIPTDEEYCSRTNISLSLLPGTHKKALNASRFAEIALGALVHNEVSLAMELCNATVHCLRECVKDTVKKEYGYEVARAYFLLGGFRAFRGDMVRYFKYRRVCLTTLSKLEVRTISFACVLLCVCVFQFSNPSLLMSQNPKGAEHIMAAMAYLDAWAYMMYNANEKKLPNIDGDLPRVSCNTSGKPQTETERTYQVCCGASAIASDPKNQMWIQGAPPVYLDNEAPLNARSLDAVACAIRSCCDQANSRFAMMSKEANPDGASDVSSDIPDDSIVTATNAAVLAHGDELCSRNMVLSAFTLLQQYEASTGTTTQHNQGHHMIISALDAFLDGGDEDSSGGFTDAQVQSLLSVCNTAIENPLLLHHGGPTYHMVSNASILLCHLMNGMHAMSASNSNGTSREMEAAVFEEVLDTFLSVRKLLSIHRRKLPVKLRCHGIPRPSMSGPKEGEPFVDLGETLMCSCRGCQGFVLMACSPCVAAERARTANTKREMEENRESEVMLDGNDLDRALIDLESEFDLDDDALLGMLSSIVSA